MTSWPTLPADFPPVSVVIPTWNEQERLPAAIASTRPLPAAEVLVVDGGSSDDTCHIARQAGARVLLAPRGRAAQMNAGARAAAGEVLLFLHADCRLPENAGAALREALHDPSVGWGAFRHRIDSPRRLLRLIEAADNFRAGVLRRPYGDQAIFVRRSLFERVGGYPDVPLLEDVLLARRLRRAGRFRAAAATVLTDSRRWERYGVLRVTATNNLILLGAALRLPISWLARLYYGDAARSRETR